MSYLSDLLVNQEFELFPVDMELDKKQNQMAALKPTTFVDDQWE